MDVEILFYVEKEILLIFEMLQYVVMEIMYIELGVKGDIVINILKLVIVEMGVEVCVLLFVNQGDKIKIDICLGFYVECVKEQFVNIYLNCLVVYRLVFFCLFLVVI